MEKLIHVVKKYGKNLTESEMNNLIRMLERLACRGADEDTLINECKALAGK